MNNLRILKKKSMKKIITTLVMAGAFSVQAQVLQTGPSTSVTPYMWPAVNGASVISILSSGESVNGYSLCAPGDGMGYLDNGSSTFTVYHNVEISYPNGSVRAHGQPGAFIQEWVIQKSNLQVISGSDLIQNVNLWTGSTYTTYNANNTSTLAGFSRFCAGDLPALHAFYNPNTGKGTTERFFMNGEESGAEGRAFAHGLTGIEDGKSYELPYLGKLSYENAIASPYPQDKTIVIELDDSSPGQVYVYVGNKSLSGTAIEKAGLVGGKLYGIAVMGMFNEINAPTPNTPFSLVDMGLVHTIPGATLQSRSLDYGITNFLRPEDGNWNPNNPNEFYFATTNSITGPSRLYRLRFTDIKNPELGGTITAVLNGTEGQKMLDNIAPDNHGNIMLQEDPGNNIYRAKIYNYNISTGTKTTLFDCDSTRFQTGGVNFLTIDEEHSGAVDIQGIKGAGWFLSFTQAHYALPNPMTEGGQLMALYNPFTAAANAEINITGNGQNIADGTAVPLVANGSDFGKSNVGKPKNSVFTIQNTSTGTLIVSSYYVNGINAGDFVITGPSTPFNIAPNGSASLTLTFNAAVNGTRNAVMHVLSSDFNEGDYDFNITGVGVTPELDVKGNAILIPTGAVTTNSNNGTNFGMVYVNQSKVSVFELQNTGTGTLTINSAVLSGPQSGEFSIIGTPAFPITLAPSTNYSLQLAVTPLTTGIRNANLIISSDDADENPYVFALQASGTIDVGINTITSSENVWLYPNPAQEAVTLKVQDHKETIQVSIMNLLGEVLFNTQLESGQTELKIQTHSMVSGLYLVKLKQDSGYTMQNLIISK